ncbi:2435_t:CDS:2 [Paraglomus occultum]|uniref:2435_t:CDS:1 n=1 Tax=Paraglomus occultum TaxID=144539 RepID=A0A9N9BAL3_9GLOM|nr:2435_t:CDS:2 [Paraglomus occultum]
MSSLLGLNYYDEEEEEEEQQSSHATDNTEQMIMDKIEVAKADHGDDNEEVQSQKNVSASMSQAIANKPAERNFESISLKSTSPTALLSQKNLPPAPTDFSTLIRRRQNHAGQTKTHYRHHNSADQTKSENTSRTPSPRAQNSPSMSVDGSRNLRGDGVSESPHVRHDGGDISPEITTSVQAMQIDEVEYEAKKELLLKKLLRPKPIEGAENWGIPAEPDTECDAELQNKIAQYRQLKDKGILFNDNLLKNKAFRNPHIYEKLVEFVELDETGSNFDKSVFDPYGFPPEAYAEKLAETQKRVADERTLAQQQQHRAQIQFVGAAAVANASVSRARHVMQSLAARVEKNAPGSTSSVSATVSTNIKPSSGKKRSSKWDVPASEVSQQSSEKRHDRHSHDGKRRGSKWDVPATHVSSSSRSSDRRHGHDSRDSKRTRD